MKKKYKLFFISMAASFSITAIVAAIVFWQVLEAGNASFQDSDFTVAELSLFNDLTELDEAASLYVYDGDEQPKEDYYEAQDEAEELDGYPDIDAYEYSYEYEEIVEPIVPRYLVALTFDDGPSSPTSQILDILEYYNAQATFFVIGRRMNQWRETALRAFENGHEIANHTFLHQALIYPLTDEEIIEEIRAGSAAIQAVTGVAPPRMVRPPAGMLEGRTTQLAASLGYSLILWDVDPLDWLNRNVDMVYDYIIENVRDGSIVVLHDTHYSTAEAMERVVPSLIEMGFELVTVTELFDRQLGRTPSPGQVYRHAFRN